MGAEGLGGEAQGVGELHQLAGEGELGRGLGRRGPGLGLAARRARARPPEDRVDAGDRIEEVGRGVALQGDHLVPGEHVVAGAVLGRSAYWTEPIPTTAAIARRSASGIRGSCASTSA